MIAKIDMFRTFIILTVWKLLFHRVKLFKPIEKNIVSTLQC